MAAITDTNRPNSTQNEDVIDEADPGISEVYIDIAGVEHSRPVMGNDAISGNDLDDSDLEVNDMGANEVDATGTSTNGIMANDDRSETVDNDRGIESPAAIDPALEPDIQSPTINEPDNRRPDLENPGRGYDVSGTNPLSDR